jgi:arabinofuranosyltransferase
MTQRREPLWLSGALCLPFLAMAWHYRFVCDDAYISFRYARNLANGHGFRFNPADPPLEGFSNLLWVLISAVFESVLMDPAVWMPVLSVACGALLLVYLHRTLIRFFPFSPVVSALTVCFLSCHPAFAIWSTSGLETLPAALAMFALFERLVLARDWRLGAVAGLALITLRVEGIAWFGVMAVLAGLAAARDAPLSSRSALLRPVWMCSAVVLGGFALLSLGRLVVFGDVVPNPVHVKVALGLERFSRGGQYLALFWLTFVPQVLLFAGALAALRWKRGAGLAVVVMAGAVPAWAVVVGGDFMPMGRMLVSGLSFGVILGGFVLHGLGEAARYRWGLEANVRRAVVWGTGAAVLVGTVLPGFDIHVVPNSVREPLHFRHSDLTFMTEWARWDNMRLNTRQFALRGQALRRVFDRDTTVVSRAIGALGYFSELHLYDQYGLVSREVALRNVPEHALDQSPGHDKMVPPIFFIDEAPDVLFSRYVFGPQAAKQIYDSLKRWIVPSAVRDVYVPDFTEVEVGDGRGRGFLFVVRRVRDGEDGRWVWSEFETRRLALRDELLRQQRRRARAKAKAVEARSNPSDEDPS